MATANLDQHHLHHHNHLHHHQLRHQHPHPHPHQHQQLQINHHQPFQTAAPAKHCFVAQRFHNSNKNTSANNKSSVYQQQHHHNHHATSTYLTPFAHDHHLLGSANYQQPASVVVAANAAAATTTTVQHQDKLRCNIVKKFNTTEEQPIAKLEFGFQSPQNSMMIDRFFISTAIQEHTSGRRGEQLINADDQNQLNRQLDQDRSGWIAGSAETSSPKLSNDSVKSRPQLAPYSQDFKLISDQYHNDVHQNQHIHLSHQQQLLSSQQQQHFDSDLTPLVRHQLLDLFSRHQTSLYFHPLTLTVSLSIVSRPSCFSFNFLINYLQLSSSI